MLGILNISLSVFGIIGTIICCGISIIITRNVSINENYGNKNKNGRLIYNSLLITTSLSIISSIIIILSKNTLSNILSGYQSYLLLVCMLPALLSNAVYTPFRAYLQGKELYFESSLVELIEQGLRIIICFGVFIILKDLDPIYSPVIAMSIAGILSSIIGISYFKKNNGKVIFGKPRIKKIISQSVPITLVKTLSMLVIPIVTIILPARLISCGYTSEEALSQLGIVTGMTLPLLSVPGTIIGSLATALIPQIAILNENKNKQKISNQISNSINFTITSTMIFVPLFIALGKPICELIFNNTIAGNLLSKGSILMLPMGLNQITTTILNSMGKEKSTCTYYMISTIFMTICVLLLPNIVGIETILWTIGVNTTIVSLLNIIKIKQELKQNIKLSKTLSISLILTIPITLLIQYSHNILSLITHNIINLGICVIVGSVATILLYYTFGIIETTHLDILKKSNKKILNKKSI